MLIYIAGTDSFLAKRAIDQIKQKYTSKNPDGAELIEITSSTNNPNWADLQAVPLFATSRLVVIKEAAKFDAATQENLAHFLTNHPASTVVVVWDGKALKAGTPLQMALAGATKTIAASPLERPALLRWIKARAAELAITLSPEMLNELLGSYGSDLWAIETELKNLQNDSTAGITAKKQSTDVPFAVFGFVRSGNWEAVKRSLASDLEQGKPLELILGGLAAAVRKEVRAVDIKKKVTDLLMDIDIGLKTGLLDERSAVALLISHLPNPAPERVRWESTWEETYLLA